MAVTVTQTKSDGNYKKITAVEQMIVTVTQNTSDEDSEEEYRKLMEGEDMYGYNSELDGDIVWRKVEMPALVTLQKPVDDLPIPS